MRLIALITRGSISLSCLLAATVPPLRRGPESELKFDLTVCEVFGDVMISALSIIEIASFLPALVRPGIMLPSFFMVGCAVA